MAARMETCLLIEPDALFNGLTGLDAEETGVALKLAIAVARADGDLKARERELAIIARCTRKKWHKIAPCVLRLFDFDGSVLRQKENPFFRFEKARVGLRPAIPAGLAKAVREREGTLCRYCGTGFGPFHLDHVEPWSRGGEHSADNLVVSCRGCNLAKGARTIQEWRCSL